MTRSSAMDAPPSAAATPRAVALVSTAQPIKIAILAMGGEGGGVLADWIAALALANGWLAQTTSVPGVAQRTGATIYYVELFPRAAAEAAGRTPVLALMPLPGDVDIVLASELMEAGRAVQRGLVTPERTTFIASTHRVYSMTEKIAMGDGRVDADALQAHARAAARRWIAFDMAEVARQQRSVIGAVLFGALAGSGALPFERAAFEATIQAGGIGVAASLKAFAAAYTAAQAETAESEQSASAPAFSLPTPTQPALRALVDRLRPWPAVAQPVALEGLRRLVDYQDPAYAASYLDRLEALRAALPAASPASEPATTEVLTEAARHLALWMSYEDTIRVAELKTRSERFERVQRDVGVGAAEPHAITEFLHPRLQEVADTLPAGLGRWLLGGGDGSPTDEAASPNWAGRLMDRLCTQGRHVTTNSIRGHLLLRAVAGFKSRRRGTLRFATEDARIEAWLADIATVTRQGDLPLALAIARGQRLVKGYGDTHARGWRSFEQLQALWRRGAVTAAQLETLQAAALADDSGQALRQALTPFAAAPSPAPAAAVQSPAAPT